MSQYLRLGVPHQLQYLFNSLPEESRTTSCSIPPTPVEMKNDKTEFNKKNNNKEYIDSLALRSETGKNGGSCSAGDRYNQMVRSMRQDWSVKASIVAKNTFNPIRSILETMDCDPNPAKKMISLSIGDPTVFGNLKPAKEVVEAVHAALDSGKHNGYGPSTGSLAAKEAVARHVSVPGGEVCADDIILCSGCSCSLDITISTLAQDGQNILVPRPGFPLYTTLSAGLGGQIFTSHGHYCT
jgi:DNA-binding transcriptional MocR family regulator